VAVVSGSVPDSLAQDVGSFKTLYSFTGQPDGANPSASVVIGGGVLYGTTQYGGTGRCTYISLGCGTVFSLTPPTSPGGAWTESVLHDFKGKCCQASEDGDNPVAPVVIGSGGVLYGTTQYGGTGSCPAFGPCGTAYSLTPPNSPGGTWAEAVYSFPGGGGGFPEAGLVIGGRGVLYGTTSGGGTLTSEYGTVFSLTPPASPGGPWTETTLWSFSGGSDGAVPEAGLVIGKDGILYGTTSIGGVEVVRDPCYPTSNGCGAVFSLATATDTLTIVQGFSPADGVAPKAGLVIGKNGVLYGTTSSGGASNAGTVFKLAGSTETVLWSFTGQPDGAGPVAGLVIGGGGVLYGTTSSGGASNLGTVFKLAPPASPGGLWTESVLHNFTGYDDGGDPVAGLAISKDGMLYGTTSKGGTSKAGTVFALKP